MNDSPAVADRSESRGRKIHARSGPLARRYYPMAIGAGFLAMVVAFFPSTVPTSSLGFVPKISAPVPFGPGPARLPTPAAPSAASSVAPIAGPTTFGSSAGMETAPVVPATDGAPVTAPATSGPTGGGGAGSSPPAACALPLPAEPPAPPAAELIEVYAAAGPFGPEATAGSPALAPVIPLVAPLLPLAGGLAGGTSGILVSQALVDLANLEDKLFAPFSSAIAAITPAEVSAEEKFFQEIGPLLTLASNLPDMDCVGDLEIAAGSTLVPADYPGAIPLTAYGPSSTAVDRRVVAVSTSWAEGVTPSFARAVNALVGQGDSVEMHLYDDVAAGQSPDDPGFADWVSGTMAAFPNVAAWEIDPYVGSTAPAGATGPDDPAGSLADAISAAAAARAPGQLLGVGLPAAAAPWWTEFGRLLSPAVRHVINFAGLDATGYNQGLGLPPAGLSLIVALVRQGTLAQGGLPPKLPLFVTAGTAASLSDAEQTAAAVQDAAALSGLGVGLLTWSSPSTLGGGLFSDSNAAQSLFAALTRLAAP